MKIAAVSALALAMSIPTAHADTFGTSGNEFTIDFVPIGNAGNADDAGAGGGIYSSSYGEPCPGTGASPGSEACTGSSGESCCNACPEACSAACTSPCKARCKSACEAARTASRPTEFGILVDTDAEGHPIFRRVE